MEGGGREWALFACLGEIRFVNWQSGRAMGHQEKDKKEERRFLITHFQ